MTTGSVRPIELVQLPLQDAVERVLATGEVGRILDEVLAWGRAHEDGGADANLIAAATLAAAPLRPDLLETLARLLENLARRDGVPTDPGRRQVLRSTLAAVQNRIVPGRPADVSDRRYEAAARLWRVRSNLESDPAEARQFLARALELYQQHGDAYGEAVASLEIGLHLWRVANDTAGATEYFAAAADAFDPAGAHPQTAGFGRFLHAQLVELATALHYEERDFERAVRLAHRATELDPQQPAAWLILANASVQEGRMERAIPAYERLIELDPDERSAARANLAGVLAQQGQYGEALRLVDESLKLRPGEIRPLLLRGQLLARAGQPDAGAADLLAVIDLLEADRPVDSDEPAARSRYREHWTMWLTAYTRLVDLQRREGDAEGLAATLRRMKSTGDDALTAMGHRISGDIAHEQGHLDEASREYEAAIRSFQWDWDARLGHALVMAESGDIAGAVESLGRIASRDAAPDTAIEGLTRLAADHPAHVRIRRWLGFAYFEKGEFYRAEENLDEYLGENGDDAEARRWLGLSLISIGADPDLAKDGPRCFRGVEELARATGQGDGEARTALLWVLDRLMLRTDFIVFFVSGSKLLHDALPLLEPLLGALEDALHGGRDYARRTRGFRESLRLAGDLGLPCFAAFLHGLYADIELLQGRLESALEHIGLAEQLGRLVFQPRSADLQDQAAATLEPELGDLAPELEHRHIYDKASDALDVVRLTAGRIRARTGDRESASTAFGEPDEIIAYAERVPPSEVAAIATALRDAGRVDDALAILDRAEARAREGTDADALGSLLMTRSTVLAMTGDLAGGVRAAQEALPHIEPDRHWVVWLNLAAFLEAAGHADEALDVLDGIDIESVARSDEDRWGYHFLRATALDQCSRPAEAATAAGHAVRLLARLREQLLDLKLRAAWAGRQESTYALAIRLAAEQGDGRRAFDLLEQSRSRVLVDELAIGRRITDDEGLAIEADLRNAAEIRDLLAALAEPGAASAIRTDALARLSTLQPDLRLRDGGSEHVDPARVEHARARSETRLGHLRERIGRHRLRTASRLHGDVTDYDATRKLLGELGSATLVEFAVHEGAVLAFLVRNDQDGPRTERILEGVDVGEWARTITRRIRGSRGDPSDWAEEQRPLQSLLDAVEAEVEEGRTLCVIPHGPLHLVPFHALQLAGGALIERNPVAYAPSASVLAHVVERSGAPIDSSALVVGDTRGDLPWAEVEARAVAEMLSSEPVPRSLATRRKLLDRLHAARTLRILHLACHGVFDSDDALASGIAASDDDPSGNAAVVRARDLLDIDLRIDLVALSACDSGLSDVRPGDELMGLSRALLVGGSRSILASLWKVNDLSTSILMAEFYRAWIGEGAAKAEALRRAQNHVRTLDRSAAESAWQRLGAGAARDLVPNWKEERDPGSSTFAAPLHWAAFTLVGDWR